MPPGNNHVRRRYIACERRSLREAGGRDTEHEKGQ